MLPSTLYRFLAEELFHAASVPVRAQLMTLALLPQVSPQSIEEHIGADANQLISTARDLGFLSGDEQPDLHPLLREFLLLKLSEQPHAEKEVRRGVDYCLRQGHWDRALSLIGRFELNDLVEPVLRQAFKPLARSGRIGTLSAFAETVRRAPSFPPPAVDVIGAEVALEKRPA